jgi:cupin fold WbuC family metalloprotein
MAEMTPIEFDGIRYALLFQNRRLEEGVHFLTSPDLPLQIGLLVHKADKSIKPHTHRHQDKLVHSTYEVLIVIEGSIEVQFYSLNGKQIGTQTIATGDIILLMNGGHGIKVLEPCRIVEVKQGPYYGINAEKSYFPGEKA